MRLEFLCVFVVGLSVSAAGQRLWQERSMPSFPNSPGARVGHAMAYDSVRHRVVLYGGYAYNPSGHGGLYGPAGAGVWEWNGVVWSRHTPTNDPGMRVASSMAFHASSGEVVLFGGDPLWGVGDDATWTWDGNVWTHRFTGGPAPRYGAAMAYDEVRDRTVLFGGVDSTNGWQNDTWEWDGLTWSQVVTANTPPASTSYPGASIVWDSIRDRIVLYDGGDVWTYDGLDWTRHFTTAQPPAGGLVFDKFRQRMVLLANAAGTLETWEWDGASWTRPTAGTPAVAGTEVAFDRARRKMMVFGQAGDVWLLDSTNGSAASYGVGCPGSAGVPRLRVSRLPILGAVDFELLLDSARPSAAAVVLFGAGRAALPVPTGCELLVDRVFGVASMVTNGQGDASVVLPIGTGAGLVGFDVYSQAWVADPGGAAFGALSSSNGRELRIRD